MRRPLLALGLLGVLACSKAAKEPEKAGERSERPAAKSSALAKVALPESLSRPAPKRLVAIGDLHGDLVAVRAAFRQAGAIDDTDRWIGGELVVVQTGDTVDRGDDDRAILDWLMRLREQAKAAGGELILLLGNHELMNVAGDFRYVTQGSFDSFSAGPIGDGHEHAKLPAAQRGRAIAFAPGGSYAKKLAQEHLLFVRVGRSVFVHGGLLAKHLRDDLPATQRAVIEWLETGAQRGGALVMAEESPVWTRAYSDDPKPKDCEQLGQVLSALDADRMVMGHTVQKGGITSVCDGKGWLIDVGMSRFYGGSIQVLEVVGDQVKPLPAQPHP